MANSVTHAGLPFPVKGARFTIPIPYLDSTGTPTDPTTPDTEVSLDGGAFADATEEETTITGGNGAGYITLTGAEMNGTLVFVAAKAASGPKTTLAMLLPRVLPVLTSGTAQAGASGTITLAAGAPAYDLSGSIVRTTGGTGGGGTGGANNQARVITAYNTSTKVATVVPNWETNPSSDTTYEILITDLWANAHVQAVAGEAADPNGVVDANLVKVNNSTNGIPSFQRAIDAVTRGTVGSSATTTSIPTSSLAPAATAADQFKGQIICFDANTATAALRGQKSDITGSTSGGVLTVTALTTAPASGDTFTIQ